METPQVELGIGGYCVRCIFCFINLVLFALAITGTVIGIIAKLRGDNFEFFVGANAAAILLIVVSSVNHLRSFIEIFIKPDRSKYLLIILISAVFIIIFIIIVLELAAAIVAFRFNVDGIDEQMRDAISRYRFDNDTNVERDVNSAVNFVQGKFRCCGADGPTDWPVLNPDFFCANGLMPPNDCSCDINDGERCLLNVTGEVTCTLPEDVVEMSYDFPSWGIGCTNNTRDDLEDMNRLVGGISVTFCVFQVLGFFVALVLIWCIIDSVKEEINELHGIY